MASFLFYAAGADKVVMGGTFFPGYRSAQVARPGASTRQLPQTSKGDESLMIAPCINGIVSQILKLHPSAVKLLLASRHHR